MARGGATALDPDGGASWAFPEGKEGAEKIGGKAGPAAAVAPVMRGSELGRLEKGGAEGAWPGAAPPLKRLVAPPDPGACTMGGAGKWGMGMGAKVGALVRERGLEPAAEVVGGAAAEVESSALAPPRGVPVKGGGCGKEEPPGRVPPPAEPKAGGAASFSAPAEGAEAKGGRGGKAVLAPPPPTLEPLPPAGGPEPTGRGEGWNGAKVAGRGGAFDGAGAAAAEADKVAPEEPIGPRANGLKGGGAKVGWLRGWGPGPEAEEGAEEGAEEDARGMKPARDDGTECAGPLLAPKAPGTCMPPGKGSGGGGAPPPAPAAPANGRKGGGAKDGYGAPEPVGP
jgi:hypothetical protein